MNNVTLRGRLTAEPEIRNYVMKDGSTGTVAAFTLAVPDRTAKRDENNNFPADFIRCSCFGKNAEVRHCAFIRGNAIVGEGAVVGNSTELKNVILFNKVQVPHYNYVGDSVLGFKAHMGAGSITSNVKSDKKLVVINNQGVKIETGLKKVGAFLGDNVEVGCGSVLNPGTVVGRESNIYPLSSVRGVVPEKSIYKCKTEVVNKLDDEI